MKNLATCKPSEFLRQTNKIKKSVEKWLTDTDILNIRRNAPELIKIEPGMEKEEAREALQQNIEAQKAQVGKNLSKMLDAILDKHPEETLELLALLCFVEPEDVDSHTMDEYLTAISEMLGCKAVIDFFISLARWGVINISS